MNSLIQRILFLLAETSRQTFHCYALINTLYHLVYMNYEHFHTGYITISGELSDFPPNEEWRIAYLKAGVFIL